MYMAHNLKNLIYLRLFKKKEPKCLLASHWGKQNWNVYNCLLYGLQTIKGLQSELTIHYIVN